MAKSKKSKKHTPRKLVIPRLITATANFDAMEKALLKIVETGEVEVDEVGFYVYRDFSGVMMSFEANLRVTAMFLEIWMSRSPERSIPLASLWALHTTFNERQPIDEEAIDEVRQFLATYGQIVKKMSFTEAKDIMASVKIKLAQDRLEKCKANVAELEAAQAAAVAEENT